MIVQSPKKVGSSSPLTTTFRFYPPPYMRWIYCDKVVISLFGSLFGGIYEWDLRILNQSYRISLEKGIYRNYLSEIHWESFMGKIDEIWIKEHFTIVPRDRK